MQLLAPALRILGRDPIISHFSGNFMNKQKSSLENLLFVLDLQKTSVQWRRMIVKKPLKNFNALVDSLHYRMKAKTSKGPPDIGDFPKRIGAWIRASTLLKLCAFSQRRSLLQYSSHRNYKSFRNAVLHQDDLCNALVLHQGHCFFYVAKMQQYFYHFWSHKDVTIC